MRIVVYLVNGQETFEMPIGSRVFITRKVPLSSQSSQIHS